MALVQSVDAATPLDYGPSVSVSQGLFHVVVVVAKCSYRFEDVDIGGTSDCGGPCTPSGSFASYRRIHEGRWSGGGPFSVSECFQSVE